MKYSYDIHYWITSIILIASLAVLVGSRNIKGKGWLIGSLAISLVVMTGYYVPNILIRTEVLTPQTYEKYMDGVAATVLGLLSICGSASLLLYILALSAPALSSPISVEQARADQTIISRCAFGGAALLCGLNFLVGLPVPGGFIGGAIGGGLGALVGMAVNSIRRR